MILPFIKINRLINCIKTDSFTQILCYTIQGLILQEITNKNVQNNINCMFCELSNMIQIRKNCSRSGSKSRNNLEFPQE